MADSNATQHDVSTAQLIGEVKGMLVTMQRQIEASTESTNRRIDDLKDSLDKQTQSINRRIEDHQRETDTRFKNLEDQVSTQSDRLDARRHDGKKAAGAGGAVGLIVTAGSELIKLVTTGG